jgi:hypothetical protein
MGTAYARSARRAPSLKHADLGKTASSISRLILRTESPVATAASLIRIALPGAISVVFEPRMVAPQKLFRFSEEF